MSVQSVEAEYLYDDFVLHVTPDKFYLEPLMSPDSIMVIDRNSHSISLQKGAAVPDIASRRRVCGVLGTVRLLAGPYLVLAVTASRVGNIDGHVIWRLERAELLQYCRSMHHLTAAQVQYNDEYLSMMQSVLEQPYFYFSYTYDLTHTFQRLYNTTPEFLQIPLHERCDRRFLWNGHLLADIGAHTALRRFCLPLMHGFISVRQCSLSADASFSWCIISRRSCYRAGTRLFCRGVDSDGNVANMVETEQIVEYNGAKFSFVQTRGSIPLYWSQYPNLYYKPTPRLSERDYHLQAMSHHLGSQVLHYGRQVLVSLIDQKGVERGLAEALDRGCRETPVTDLRYEPFDFHHECRKLRWHRLSLLMDRLAPDLDVMGYFLLLRDGSLACSQEGVFRTNCIDCLDRTNVVQSLLARQRLEDVLHRLQLLGPDNRLVDCQQFTLLFQHVWADNADLLSCQYAATPALKTDFTRTGRRTVWGAVRDGYHSLLRYYRNNFRDGWKQDAMDLFLGNYIVEPGEAASGIKCPLSRSSDWRFPILLLLLLGSFIMFLSTLYFPIEYTVETLLYVIFWGVMGYGSLAVILIYGDEFVQSPRLCPLVSGLPIQLNRKPPYGYGRARDRNQL